jgi:hypothetical protein
MWCMGTSCFFCLHLTNDCILQPQEGVSQDDIEKRTQHLRDMRDRILSKRRQEREMAAEHGERLTPQVQPEAKHAPQKTTEELEADKKRAVSVLLY